MAARTVLLNLIGQDRVSRMLRGVRREVEETERQVDQFNRTSKKAGKDTDRSFTSIAKSIGKVIGKSTKFASIGLGAGLAITQAANLAAALAPLAGLLAGIPAAIAVAGAAFATLKLALSGVGDAFKAAMGDDAEKFEESLKNLAPAAQKVARELREIRPQLLGVRKAAQQAFFAPLAGQLRSTAAALSGPLKQGVRAVAAEYGAAASSAFAFTRESKTASAVTSIFAGTRDVIAGIRPAMTPILQGFRDMAVQGVATLSNLATGAGSVGQRFGEWMQKFAASGGVQRALEGALVVVKQLGSLLLNIGGILNSIIKAAQGGGGLLGFLSQAVAQLNAFLKTAAAQQAMTSFFQTMGMLGTALAPIVPIVGQLAAALISALMPVVQAVAPVLTQVVGILGQTVAQLVPAFAPLSQLLVVVAQGLGQIVTAVGPLLPALATMITQLLTGLVPVLTPVVELIAQTAAQIGGALVKALVAMMPSLTQLVLSVSTLLPVWAQLTPLFTQLLVALLPLAPPLIQIATILVTLLVPVLRLAIMILTKYWSVIIGLVIPVVNKLAAIFTWVAGALQTAINVIGAAAMWLWRNAIQPAWNGIRTAIGIAWGIIKPIFDTIVTIVKVVLGGAFLVLWNVVKVVWILIAAAVKVAWAVLKWVFGLIWSVISKTLGPVFRWLYDKVIRPVWNKIGGVIQDVWQRWIRPAFDKLKSAVGKVRDAFKVAVDGIKRVWDKIKGIAKTPVNFVIGLYNDGIANLVNKIAKFAGIGTRLDKIPKFAAGGIMPGYSPGVDSLIAAVSPGEAIMRPEFTRAVGAGFVHRANDVARRSGVDGVRRWLTGPDAIGGEGLAFARGGVVPGFAGNFGFGGIIGRFVKGVKDWTIGNVGKAASSLLGKILKPVPGTGVLRDVVNAIPAWIKDQILKWIKKHVASGGPGAKKALAFARSQEGKPYVWGGVGPGGYDCCLIGSTRVFGPDGARPIRDVRAGDRVYAHVGGRLTAQTVTAAWQSKHQPVFAVRTRNRTVTGSANHPFLRVVMTEPSRPVKGGRPGEQTPARYGVEWARLDELQRGDLLVQPRAMELDTKPHPELADGTPVDVELAWLIGAAVGDGSVTDNALRLCMYGEDRDRATRIVRERWGCNPCHGDKYGLIASSVDLARSLAELGMRRRCLDKRVPEAVWTWPTEQQRAFLDGYCDADGHRPADQKKHGERTYSSASEDLIADVRALHIMLGDAVSNVSVNRRTKPVTIKGKLVKNTRPLYTFVVWTGQKTGELALRRRPGLAEWLDSGDFTLAAVLAVDAKGDQDTWDLEVEGAHNFVADGVVVHNSGFMSALTNVIQGKNPYSRRFTTFSFTGAKSGPAGFVKGLRSAFSVGVTNAGVGHMAGTLLGHNVESSGSAGVRVDSGARGTSDRLFNLHYGLKFDRGGLLPEGWSRVYNGTGAPEPVLTRGQFDTMAAGRGGPLVSIDTVVVREKADVDLLAERIGFASRAVAF